MKGKRALHFVERTASGRFCCAVVLCASSLLGSDHVVRVTVLARAEDGRALSSLHATDFKVIDGGEARRIVSFSNLRPPQRLMTRSQMDVHFVSNRPGSAFHAKQPATVLLIDTRNTDPEFQPWQAGQATRFLSLLRPDEDVAVYQLKQDGLKLLHDFSSDTASLIQSIFPRGSAGPAHDFPALEPDTANEFASEASDKQLRSRRYELTCRSIALLASQFAPLSGRKNILWLTGDFPALYGAPKKDVAPLDSAVTSAAAKAIDAAGVALYPVDVRSAFPPEAFERMSPGSSAAIPARRRSVVSHEMPAIIAGIAASTGGKSISNRSQLAEAMFDAVEETRFAYSIGFSVPDSAWDGRFHRLEITTRLHGAIVTAKQVYYAGEAGPQESSDLNKTGVGLSVHAAAGSGELRLEIHIDPMDLRWTKARDGWDAICSVRISRLVGDAVAWTGTKSFHVSEENHARLADYDLHFTAAVNAQTDTPEISVLVRDLGSSRTGLVVLRPDVIRGRE